MATHERYVVDHLGYRPQLDGLRAVAVLCVIAIHSLQTFEIGWSREVLTGGFAGVNLFFVLSGFLITSLLMEEWTTNGQITVRRFYERRALRLFPALFAVLVVQVCYSMASGTAGAVEWRTLWMVVLYISNFGYAFSSISPGLAHTWSLGVEEQFYLVWPLLLLALLRRGMSHRTLIVLIAAGLAASTLDSIVSWSVDPVWHHIYTRTDINAVALLIGAALAVIVRRGIANKRILRPIAILGWICFGVAVAMLKITTAPTYMGGLLFLSLAAAGMVVGAVTGTGPFTRLLTLRITAWVGKRSYGLYLWHVPIIVAVEEQVIFFPQLMRALTAVVLTFAMAAISFRFIEQPFLRRKSRFAFDRQTESAAGPSQLPINAPQSPERVN
jgi:peptidoglycan/LPS O-acetylase OafA/YrhL